MSMSEKYEGWLIISFFTGIFLGVMACDMFHHIDNTPNKQINYSQMEKTLDKAQCDAEKVEILWAERIRLTGKPNP